MNQTNVGSIQTRFKTIQFLVGTSPTNDETARSSSPMSQWGDRRAGVGEHPGGEDPSPAAEQRPTDKQPVNLSRSEFRPAVEGQRPTDKPAQGTALGTPNKDDPSPERALQLVPPFQGWILSSMGPRAVALGWLVVGPLALCRRNISSTSHVPSRGPHSWERVPLSRVRGPPSPTRVSTSRARATSS